jgi:hypothetical protein
LMQLLKALVVSNLVKSASKVILCRALLGNFPGPLLWLAILAVRSALYYFRLLDFLGPKQREWQKACASYHIIEWLWFRCEIYPWLPSSYKLRIAKGEWPGAIRFHRQQQIALMFWNLRIKEWR